MRDLFSGVRRGVEGLGREAEVTQLIINNNKNDKNYNNDNNNHNNHNNHNHHNYQGAW